MSSNGDSGELRFNNKVAIVTGGCRGIGRACADIMAEQGGKIAVLDINDEVGETHASVSVSGEMFYIHCDMTKEEEIKNAIEQVVEKYGQIDCLVNNVGTHNAGNLRLNITSFSGPLGSYTGHRTEKKSSFGLKICVSNNLSICCHLWDDSRACLCDPGSKTIDELTVESFRDLLNLNLVSNFTASKYALPYLRKCKGSIVNISSNCDSTGTGLASSYSATKGGCLSLTKALAIDEAKHGVRVNAISPSCVDTPLLRSTEKAGGNEIDEERMKYLGSLHTLNRIAEPREIGKACLFLAVDATFTTGESLKCTGGYELGYGVKP